jgi:hypothetical protein
MNDEPLKPKPLALRIKKKRYVGPCIYKIRHVKSPIQEVERGWRILVAVPNMDGTKPYKSTPCAMFTSKYLIMLSSDYCDYEIGAMEQAVIRYLRNRGFNPVEEAEAYEERMMIRMGLTEEAA